MHALLSNRTFVSLLGIGALNGVGRWLDMLVIAIFVLEVTASPLMVASMLVLRLLPMTLFGLFGGAIAQKFERWHLLRVATLTATLSGLALYLLASLDLLAVWHVALSSFISGLVWSTDFPVRRTLMADIAGAPHVSRAMSLDILAGASTRMLGPLLGGLIYQQIGPAGAFALAMTLYLLALLITLPARASDSAASDSKPSIKESLHAGVHALKGNDVLLGVIGVTVVFNLWGLPFVSMVPVFAREVLHLSEAATGMLVSAEGAGAILCALLLSIFARPHLDRYVFVFSVLGYCAFALVFALIESTWLNAALLLTVGFVSASFGAMQSALIIMNAPAGLERQMMGVLSVAIGTAPLGFLSIGALANWFGVATACAITAVMGIVGLIAVLLRWPGLLSRQPLA